MIFSQKNSLNSWNIMDFSSKDTEKSNLTLIALIVSVIALAVVIFNGQEVTTEPVLVESSPMKIFSFNEEGEVVNEGLSVPNTKEYSISSAPVIDAAGVVNICNLLILEFPDKVNEIKNKCGLK